MMKTMIITILFFCFITPQLFAAEMGDVKYKYDFTYKDYSLERGEARKERIARDVRLSGTIEWIQKNEPNMLMQVTVDKSSVLWTDSMIAPEDSVRYECLKSPMRCLISFNKERIDISIVEGLKEKDTYRNQYKYVTKILESLLLTVSEKKWVMKEYAPSITLDLHMYSKITFENGKYRGMDNYGSDAYPVQLNCVPEMVNNPKSTKLVFSQITRTSAEFFNYVYDAVNDRVIESARTTWGMPLDDTKIKQYSKIKFIPETWPDLVAGLKKADNSVQSILNDKIGEDIVDSSYGYTKIILTEMK
jgi:hypothetical protein